MARAYKSVTGPIVRLGRSLEYISTCTARWSGSTSAFVISVLLIGIWLISGPLFHFSDTWQLVINTAGTIVTLLMVFLIQRSQNKESAAIQLKLNELIGAVEGASNRLINVEDRSEEEVVRLQRLYRRVSRQAKQEDEPTRSVSIEKVATNGTPASDLQREIYREERQARRHRARARALRARLEGQKETINGSASETEAARA